MKYHCAYFMSVRKLHANFYKVVFFKNITITNVYLRSAAVIAYTFFFLILGLLYNEPFSFSCLIIQSSML